jgi:hypothetical protein
MTTVGEPIEPEVWRWYYHTVGKEEAVIVDTWWQTENGGFLGSTLPALHELSPRSPTSPTSETPPHCPTPRSSTTSATTYKARNWSEAKLPATYRHRRRRRSRRSATPNDSHAPNNTGADSPQWQSTSGGEIEQRIGVGDWLSDGQRRAGQGEDSRLRHPHALSRAGPHRPRRTLTPSPDPPRRTARRTRRTHGRSWWGRKEDGDASAAGELHR